MTLTKVAPSSDSCSDGGRPCDLFNINQVDHVVVGG